MKLCLHEQRAVTSNQGSSAERRAGCAVRLRRAWLLAANFPTAVVIGKNKSDAMVICEMDAVIGRDFQSELPGIITRTLSSAVLKATATKQLSDKAGDIGTVAGTMYQIFSTQADLRTWTSLPKSFAVARIKTPSDRKLTLFVGPQKNEVTVNKGEVNVVYLKGFAHGAPLKIHQFRLK